MSETPATTPPAASPKPTTAPWLNPWYALFFTFLGAYVLYIAVVCGRMTHDTDEPVPRSLNAILLTGLSMAALLSFVAAGRLRRDRERKAEQARLGEWMGSVMAVLADLQQQGRGRGETTEDLSGRKPSPGRVVFVASSPVYGTDSPGPAPPWRPPQPAPRGGTHDAVGAPVEGAPVREAFMHGYQLGRHHKANGSENVLPMPPAHGG